MTTVDRLELLRSRILELQVRTQYAMFQLEAQAERVDSIRQCGQDDKIAIRMLLCKKSHLEALTTSLQYWEDAYKYEVRAGMDKPVWRRAQRHPKL